MYNNVLTLCFTRGVNLQFQQQKRTRAFRPKLIHCTWGDSDVISVPAGFRRHLVGKTDKCFHRDITEIRFVGKLINIQTFS